MPTGKPKALRNSLKVQKALLLAAAFEERLQNPWFYTLAAAKQLFGYMFIYR